MAIERTLRKHGNERHMDRLVHKANVAVLKPVANAYRRELSKHTKSHRDPRSGAKQRSKSRSNRAVGNVRIFKSKKESLTSRVTVTKNAFWAHLLETGTKPRRTRSGASTGVMPAMHWAEKVRNNMRSQTEQSIVREYNKIYYKSMANDIKGSRKTTTVRI
jgi:hypothetical protein